MRLNSRRGEAGLAFNEIGKPKFKLRVADKAPPAKALLELSPRP
jgi:hypothetical protein